MTDRYVSAGGDSSTPSNPTNTAGHYPTFSAAVAALAASGDRIGVNKNMNSAAPDNYTAAQTFDLKGTLAIPTIVFCFDPADGSRSTGAMIQTTGNFNITRVGYCVIDGVEFKAGVSATSATHITLGTTNTHGRLRNTTLHSAPQNGSRISNGGAGSKEIWDNVTIDSNHVGMLLYVNDLLWRNSPVAFSGTLPNTCFAANGDANIVCENNDLSMQSGKTLIGQSSGVATRVTLRRCALPTTYTEVSGGVFVNPSSFLYLDECSKPDGVIIKRFLNYYGAADLLPNSVYRSGGAADEVQGYSLRMAANANVTRYFPLESFFPINIMVTAAMVGVPQIATIHLLADSGATLAANEAWGEINYPAGNTLLNSRSTTGPANPLANGTAPGADSGATWTGGTTPTKYKIDIPFTPGRVGEIQGRVFLGKASTTIYVDPSPSVAPA